MEPFNLRCLVLFIWAVSLIQGAVNLPPVICDKPIATTVALDPPRHRFYPHFVTLHRCQGSVGISNPSVEECVATSYKELEIMVLSPKTHQRKPLTVKNHTSCGPSCTADPTECDHKVQKWNQEECACDCLYDRPPPESIIPHKNGFRWDKHSCRYECRGQDVCSEEQEWDDDTCSCVCRLFNKHKCVEMGKDIDDASCECIEPQAQPGGGPNSELFTHDSAYVLVVLLVIALLVILLLTGLLFHRCKTSRSMKSAWSQTISDTETIADSRSQTPTTLHHVSAV